jgi:hypothetical protein
LRKLPQVHALRGIGKEICLDLVRLLTGICPHYKP